MFVQGMHCQGEGSGGGGALYQWNWEILQGCMFAQTIVQLYKECIVEGGGGFVLQELEETGPARGSQGAEEWWLSLRVSETYKGMNQNSNKQHFVNAAGAMKVESIDGLQI